MAANITKVDVEDYAALTEIAHDFADFIARILQHLGHGADTEVQPVVAALLDRDEPLQPVDGAQNVDDALIARRRRAGIMRMAGRTNLVLIAYRDHAVEKVNDPLPGLVGRNVNGSRQLAGVFGFGQFPSAVATTA